MKILVASLFLLFLSGTYSSPIETQEVKPPPRPAIRDSVKSIIHNVFVFGAEVVANWESSHAEREDVLHKRVQSIWESYFNFAIGVTEYMGDIVKEVNKEIEEKYPVYAKKVLPILGSVVFNAVQKIHTAAEEMKPYFEKFEEQLKPIQIELWEGIRPIIENRTRSTIEDLNANIKPFLEGVRKEVVGAKVKDDESPDKKPTGILDVDIAVASTQNLQHVLMFDIALFRKIFTELHIFGTKV